MSPADVEKSLGCPSKMYLCSQIGVMNSILEITTMERYTNISESSTAFQATSHVLRIYLPMGRGEEIMAKSIELSGGLGE